MTDVAPARHGAAGVRIADGLRRAILSGEYEPGARIRQDDLADLHGASRLPVREALRMLEGEGLVTLVANTGAWVSSLSLAECEEMYQMRERIEPLLLRYNVPLLSEQQIDELERLATVMEGANDLEDFIALDREFHLSSYAVAETSVLGDTVLRLWNRTQHYRRAFMRVFRTEGDRSVHLEHHLLVSAIRRRDLDESERVLTGHIRRTRLELARHPEVFSA
ncbi:GntR family transcriptional regulator [Leifsonia sp. H3M29-4]|uniref:GntR family transcriptional regulator n=1 Tax=Salinibacterium metalliresistens TaxID=3031321 RepID=UPI0023DBFC44|nr:GntR family transcriptional regulator [Salinibacterium metalliresistens]MDF1478188.1 GntR family transcriptional regulator [Salinibacterium metalliresistens]